MPRWLRVPVDAWSLAALLAIGALWGAVGVGEACRPNAPLFDHAVLMADMLHAPPHWWAAHNEHRPVMPRLVFWAEAALTGGDTRLPVAVGIFAVVLAMVLVARPGRRRRSLVTTIVALAVVLRPPTMWALSWPTNLQYPLALLGAAIAFSTPTRPLRVLAGTTIAVLSSAEGLWVAPIVAAFAAWERRRGWALVWLLVGGAAVVVCTRQGNTGLQFPETRDQLWHAARFVSDLVSFPWSFRFAGVMLLPVVVAAWRGRRRRGGAGSFLAMYGAGFSTMVALGRWWLPEVYHRYVLGIGIVVAGMLIAHTARWGRRAGRLVLWVAVLMALESYTLAPAISNRCQEQAPPGTAFWAGQTDDGAEAHPGFPPAIARELRAHLWSFGLYRDVRLPVETKDTAPRD